MQDRGSVGQADAVRCGEFVDLDLGLCWLERPGQVVNVSHHQSAAIWREETITFGEKVFEGAFGTRAGDFAQAKIARLKTNTAVRKKPPAAVLDRPVRLSLTMHAGEEIWEMEEGSRA